MLLDWLFPRHCLGCSARGQYICPDCINRIQPIKNPICPQCSQKNLHGFTHARCLRPQALNGLTSTLSYHGLVKRAVKKLKFHFVRDVNQTLVELSVSLGDLTALQLHPWLVTPVPLHSRRERWRGFNQSHHLARALAAYFSWPYAPNLLQRTKHTKPQSLLSGRERAENLQGAFAPGKSVTLQPPKGEEAGISSAKSFKSVIKSHPLLIVDDVWTTGATLRECAKVLKRNGAQKVWGFTIARSE